MPVLQGPLKGMRWIVGSQTHGMWLGSYEVEKQLAVKARLRPGLVFYDVGANVGYYSLLAAKYVDNTGEVIAFEPFPKNIEYLSHHILLNRLTNIKIIPKALSDHSGKDKFFCGNEASSCHINPEGNIEVTVSTLDAILKEESIRPPDIIKVDIEGSEIDFLKGAVNILKINSPLIFMAVHSPQLFVLLFKTITELKLPYVIRDLNGEIISKDKYVDEVMLTPL